MREYEYLVPYLQKCNNNHKFLLSFKKISKINLKLLII